MTLSDLYRVIDTDTRVELIIESMHVNHTVYIGKFYDCPAECMEWGVKKISLKSVHTVAIVLY